MASRRLASLVLACAVLAACACGAKGTLCKTYIIQSGDSLWSIANANGVTTDALLAALQQCIAYTDSTVLQVGQQICLPPWEAACTYVSNSAGIDTCKIYQVQAGDTLASIASSFGLYAPDFQTLNSDLATSPLGVGTVLRLPPWDETVCPDPGSDYPSCRVYVVVSGDSIWSIASAFYITTDALLSVNSGLSTSSVLSPGQRIQIPPYPSKCGSGFVAQPPTTAITSCRGYVVQSGDSIAYIALKFATTTSAIVAVNAELADPSLLTPGKTIKIPPYPDTCSTTTIVTGATVASPSPIAVTSPSPAATTASPSPKASPSPSPSPATTTTASPSPTTTATSPATAPATAPTPASSTTVPSTSVKVSITLTGISVSSFSALQSQLVTRLAALAGVPTSYITITSAASATASAKRRLQASGDATTVTATIATSSTAATKTTLTSAAASGSVASSLSSLGLGVSAMSIDGTAVTLASTTSPSPSASSPAPTSSSSSSGGGSNTGAIVGGVVGGVGGALVAAAVVFIVIRKRRAAAEPSAPVGGVTANVRRVATRASGKAVAEDPTVVVQQSATPDSTRARAARGAGLF